MFALAQRNGVAIPFASVEEVRAAYSFSQPAGLPRHLLSGRRRAAHRGGFPRPRRRLFRPRRGGRRRPCRDLLRSADAYRSRHRLRHGDATGCSPAWRRPRRGTASRSKLILCFLRHLDEDAAFATLEQARALARPDRRRSASIPPSSAIRRRSSRGCSRRRAAHGPEARRPCRRGRAARLCLRGARPARTSTGSTMAIAALEDPALTARLAREQMTLTVCPLSNLKLCVVDDMAAHPIDAMLRAGPARDDQFGRSGLFRRLCRRQLPRRGGGRAASIATRLATLARNSFLGSFLTEDEKAAHLARLDAYRGGVNGRRTMHSLMRSNMWATWTKRSPSIATRSGSRR